MRARQDIQAILKSRPSAEKTTDAAADAVVATGSAAATTSAEAAWGNVAEVVETVGESVVHDNAGLHVHFQTTSPNQRTNALSVQPTSPIQQTVFGSICDAVSLSLNGRLFVANPPILKCSGRTLITFHTALSYSELTLIACVGIV